MSRFFGGFFACVILIAVVGLVAVKFGFLPARADDKPSKLERIIAHTSLDATIAREEPQPPYPYPTNDTTVLEGAKLYTQHCAMCHGNAEGNPTILAKGLYIRPPQLGKHGVDDDPQGTNYWKIEHGIRFTAMPSYKDTLTEKQIWSIVSFLSVPAEKLTGAAAAEFRKPVVE